MRRPSGLGRYLRLLRIFWSNAVTTDLEYRVNFWSNAFLSLFWLVWAAAGIGDPHSGASERPLSTS